MDRTRKLLALLMLAVGTTALGCAQCANPYDYCGPTFTGECGDQCDAQYRAGSILGGGPGGLIYEAPYESGEIYYEDEGEIYYEDEYGYYEDEEQQVSQVAHHAEAEYTEPARLAPAANARPVRHAAANSPRGPRR